MNKKLVIDLDDTISFCHDRDWQNATPNIPVIRKINSLYNSGWDIEVYSARGSLSGINYFDQVTNWLVDNGVLYTSLRFGKPLATLYVDDKCCSTEDFVHINITEIQSWSGSTVLRIGNRIHKTDPNIVATLKWYKQYSQLFFTPRVLGVTGTELILQYIEPKRKATVNDAMLVLDALKTYSSLYDWHNQLDYTWLDYITRISNHCDLLYKTESVNLSPILKHLSTMPEPVKSLSHGDLTPDNLIINRHGEIILIDPLQVTYPSYELDRAKIVAWGITHYTDNFQIIDNVPRWNDFVVNHIVIAELIRTIRYAPELFKQKMITVCLNYLKNLEGLESK
jgi:hypothetical protein